MKIDHKFLLDRNTFTARLLSFNFVFLKCIFVDEEAPVFKACPDNQTMDTQPGQAFAVATWQNISATDNSGNLPKITCDPQSGSNFTIGQTMATCAAADSSGNINTCSFLIAVEGKRRSSKTYHWSGYIYINLQPVRWVGGDLPVLSD